MGSRIEVLPKMCVKPQIAQTEKGKVEYHLSEGDRPLVLVSHGGIGGPDQARVIAG